MRTMSEKVTPSPAASEVGAVFARFVELIARLLREHGAKPSV